LFFSDKERIELKEVNIVILKGYGEKVGKIIKRNRFQNKCTYKIYLLIIKVMKFNQLV